MRFRFAALVIAVAAVTPSEVVRIALAGATSALLESLPFIVIAALLRSVLPPAAIAFAGCGCTPGPSARSIPAAAALWPVFGPIAVVRIFAGCVAARLIGVHTRTSHDCARLGGSKVLTDLQALVPPALAAGILQLLGSWEPARVAPWLQFAGGALVGALSAPCGLGTSALATSLHVRAPFAAAGLLCTAGIVDVRSLASRSRVVAHDALAYGMLALATAVVAVHRGAGFIHPFLGAALLPCASIAMVAMVRFRKCANGAGRVAPAILLAGAFAGSPPPQYRATETTLAGLFAGERLTFTGTLLHGDVLERYAITCCRADAMPVAVRCMRKLPFANSTWVQADGTVVERNGAFFLDVATALRIAAPADPFVYR